MNAANIKDKYTTQLNTHTDTHN